MTLPKAQPRKLVHSRDIECRAYLRDDGLWDIEAHLRDTKTGSAGNDWRTVAAGEPIHEMRVRLTVSEDMVVREAHASTAHGPYPACADANGRFGELAGLRIAPGWTTEVKRHLGGGHGCTHVRELLAPLATTALQAVAAARSDRMTALRADGVPKKVDSCFAYAAGGELVKRLWPEHHRPG
jgi:hypothetical protein